MLVHKLQHVFVARNHVHGIRLSDSLSRQRADNVVGFVASKLEDGNSVGFERPADIGQLLRQVPGHFFAISFVALILDFLEGLGLQVKAANAGQAFRLLIAKSGRSHIKHGGEIGGRKVIAQFAQHVYENVRCRRGQAGLGRHAALPRHGVISAEDERHGVDQVNASCFG